MKTNSINAQFNVYKYTEMAHQFKMLMAGVSNFQIKLGLAMLSEWCWTYSRDEIIAKWLEHYKEPKLPMIPLTILQYNIRYFNTNQYELEDMISRYSPSIISLNELGAIIPEHTLEKTLFSNNIFMKEGTNTHGGAVLAVNKRIKATTITIDEPNIVAITVKIGNKTYTVVSVYCPPTEPLSIAALSSLKSVSKNIIIVGDLNAKHLNWGCHQVNQKGNEFSKWLDEEDISVQNANIKTSLRSNTTIDCIISTEPEFSVQYQSLAYTSSDHLPILAEFNNIEIQNNKIYVPKIYWNVYQAILTMICKEIENKEENNAVNTFKWFEFFQQLLCALKHRITKRHKAERKRPTLSPSFRLLIKHKHYLQNKYRHSRLEIDRLRLRSWHKLLQHEFQGFKTEKWDKFIMNAASSHPTTFWKAARTLNKKKPIQFSAINNNNNVYKSPKEIIDCLHDHFSTRFAPPTVNTNNTVDQEAQTV